MADFRRLCVARLIRLVVALHEWLRIRRNVGLRVARAKRWLLAAGERLRIVVAAVLEIVVVALLELLIVATAAAFRPLRLEVWILLAELFVRRRDQAKIMFGMLKIIFGRDRIAGRLGVTGKLEIFLRHVIGRSANFHIRAVRLVNPSQGILIAPVVLLLITTPAHTLVVMMLLTVSHGFVVNDSSMCRGSDPAAIVPASNPARAGTQNPRRLLSAQPIHMSCAVRATIIAF
jgi:hypothetical protein